MIADRFIRAFENRCVIMADSLGNTIGGSNLHSGSSSEVSTGHTFERTQDTGKELPTANSCTPAGDVESSSSSRGKNYAKNQRKKLKRKAASSAIVLLPEERATNSRSSLRFQIKLENGFFTDALKDELLCDLNIFLYQTSPGSLIPSFFGCGIRYGRMWFSPENQESHDWLKQKLMMINEKAVDGFKFVFEPFSLHTNNICLRVPWNAKENLNQTDVLNRLVFQNPSILANFWKINNIKPLQNGHRLFFCSIGDDSVDRLKKQNFMVNYGFHKISACLLTKK